jgi:hypothetical protein
MKIALCFSGQPRFVKECAQSIITNVIQDYDVDIFAHLWFDEDLQNKPYKYGGSGGWKDQRIPSSAIDYFKNMYSPLKLVIEPSKVFADPNLEHDFDLSEAKYWPGSLNGEPDFMGRQINNVFSYFYSLSEVNRMRKLYEYENKINYDYVIRCRTDTYVNQPIPFENFDPKAVHFTNTMQQPPFINDWINFGGAEAMEAFMGVFPLAKCLTMRTKESREGTWCIELIHVELMERMGIPLQRHPFSVSLPRF